MLFILELMAAISMAMLLASGNLANYTFETTRADAGHEVQFLSYVGGKIYEDCQANLGTCTGVASGNLPATLPPYYSNVNVIEPSTGSDYTVTVAASSSGNAQQQAFSIDDPAKFTPDELAGTPFQGGGQPPAGSTLYLHYDPCQNGVYSSTTASAAPAC